MHDVPGKSNSCLWAFSNVVVRCGESKLSYSPVISSQSFSELMPPGCKFYKCFFFFLSLIWDKVVIGQIGGGYFLPPGQLCSDNTPADRVWLTSFPRWQALLRTETLIYFKMVSCHFFLISPSEFFSDKGYGGIWTSM